MTDGDESVESTETVETAAEAEPGGAVGAAETAVSTGTDEAETAEPADYGEAWVYESFLGALPGITISESVAISIQIGLFGTGVLVLGVVYDLEQAILPGLVAVGVAGAGSLAMLRFSRAVRRLDPPSAYRQLLFGSSIEVVLAVLAFTALVVYLLVADPFWAGSSLLVELFGEPLPLLPTYLALLVLWDLCYRIGTSWWAAVVALWRAWRLSFDPATTRAYQRLDALNVGFSLVQLALVPFILDRPVLLVAVCGHVLAVAVVEAAAIVLQK